MSSGMAFFFARLSGWPEAFPDDTLPPEPHTRWGSKTGCTGTQTGCIGE